MSVSKNLQEIIIKQKTILAELEKETNIILSSNLTIENDLLKKEVEQLQVELKDVSNNLNITSSKNAELKNALHEQIYSEKLQIISSTFKKNDVYFKSSMEGELNQLSQLEKDTSYKINSLTNELKSSRVDASNAIYEQLSALSLQATELVMATRAKISKEIGAFSKESHKQFDELKKEQITDEIIESIAKKNNLETFVGGNLINKLGVIFVILGIIAMSRFTFFLLPDTFKGIIMFVISGGFLAVGEFLNRKKTSIFSLGITSSGIAGLYVSLSISYFALNILSMYPAILLCMLITAGTFVLSQRYNSQTIAAFALIGGYIPIVSISESIVLTYSAMGYFVVLNLLALAFSFYKKWKITMYIGYFLNLVGTLYILFNILQELYNTPFGMQELSTMFYVLFAFAIYTIIPVLSNYRSKQPFTKPDVIIMGINTFFSSIIMYFLFYALGISEFNGLMAIAFALTYIWLGWFIETHFVKENNTRALFYLTGLTFVVLVIPFQFGAEWLSLGWLVQGVSIVVYGIMTREKSFKKAGFVILGLCLASFVHFDLMLRIDNRFPYKYLAITLGSSAVLAAFAYKKSLANIYENAYKYAVLVNIWFYSLYLISLFNTYLQNILQASFYNADFLSRALATTITFLLALVLPRISILADKGVKIISVGMSVLGLYGLSNLIYVENIMISTVSITAMPLTIRANIILIILCSIAVLTMYNILMFFILEARLSVEWLPFGVSAYFLLILTQNIITQYGLNFTSIVISIVYVVAALGWIFYGFMKRFAFMRRFGLVLSILAVAKLFLIDLTNLTQGYKIISYFAFGVTLLGISFIYQHFSKALALKGVEVPHVEENNDTNNE